MTEVAADAVPHGRAAWRGFLLGLSRTASGTLLTEGTDTRGDEPPVRVRRTAAGPGGLPAERGHGLLLVEAPADRWGVRCGPMPRRPPAG